MHNNQELHLPHLFSLIFLALLSTFEYLCKEPLEDVAMKRTFIYLLPVCFVVLMCGCGIGKSVQKDTTGIRDQSSLLHWAQHQDSIHVSKKKVSDLNTGENNIKRMQYDVDKEKNNPYSGELLYHILKNLINK